MQMGTRQTGLCYRETGICEIALIAELNLQQCSNLRMDIKSDVLRAMLLKENPELRQNCVCAGTRQTLGERSAQEEVV